MVLHVKDDKTDWLVREFARRRGLGITEAIRTAIEEATEREVDDLGSLKRRLEPLVAEVRSRKHGGFKEAQAAVEEMWD